MKLLIATTNPAKLNELTEGLKPLTKKRVRLISLKDLKISQRPKETEDTFAENAKIKARFYGELTDYPTIADDGGLVIDALKGAPGVRSRRWLGRRATDEELIAYTLKHLQGLPTDKRTAQLVTCVCFYDPKTKATYCQQESIKGLIAEKPSNRRIPGYPFRALFIVEEFNKYYDELSKREHIQINHRLKAIRKLTLSLSFNLSRHGW